jgi:glycine oxidase
MKAGVAGAGILGRLLSLALYRAGWDVTLFDKTHNGHASCSMTAAGLLAPVSELNKTEYVIHQLGCDAIDIFWPAILKNQEHWL